MAVFRKSLAARIFLAIAATAVLIIAIMALLVALSMRDGFARYLLRAELTRFDDLERALILVHDADAPGWPKLTADPGAWKDFVRQHFDPRGLRPGPPFGAPPSPRPPTGAPPPPRPPGGDPLVIEERLVLLGSDGSRIVGAANRPGLFEQRKICADADCSGESLLGYIGLNVPHFSATGGDAFFLRRQYVSLALSALIAVLVSAVVAFFVARQILAPIRQLELGANKLASGNYTTRIPQNSTDELGQVIDNLLQNALHDTNAPAGIRIHAQDAPYTLNLIVEDTPPGRSDADLPRLFDRFFCTEGSRSRALGGSGLGLSVSKAIVEAHGGTITAKPSGLGGLRITMSFLKDLA